MSVNSGKCLRVTNISFRFYIIVAIYCNISLQYVTVVFCLWISLSTSPHTHILTHTDTGWKHLSLLEAISLLSVIDPVLSEGITIEMSWHLDIEIHKIYIKGPHWFEVLWGRPREKEEIDKTFFFLGLSTSKTTGSAINSTLIHKQMRNSPEKNIL